MRLDWLKGLILLLLVVFADASCVFSQSKQTGSLSGTIRGSNGTPLPAANVLVVGTSNGVVADLNGNYFIEGISAGKRRISFSYVGYETKTIDVNIKSDAVTKLDVTLEITGVKTKEVVVTAQRLGQQTAINEQINSINVKNVVAADRLQSNPDQNVTEALGRLPGISIISQGGEGTAIMIRGMAPQYTQILLDGIAIPTIFSPANISQYALQGVEVFKTITPDMEADATGGVVNLTLGKAPSGLHYDLMSQGGYNSLNNYFKNYRIVGDISDRFFDDNLGIKVNLTTESLNRSTQSLSAGYQVETVPPPGQLPPMFVGNINLDDIGRINSRVAGSVVLDYRLSSVSELVFNNFFVHSDQNYTDVSKSYNITNGIASYNINYMPHSESNSYVGSLKGKSRIGFFEVDGGVSFAQTHAYTPISKNWSFWSNGATLRQYGSQAAESLPLNQILAGATDTLSSATLKNFYLYSMGYFSSYQTQKNASAYLNVKMPYQFGASMSGYIKFGGEYKGIMDDFNYNSQNIIPYIIQMGPYAKQVLPWVGDVTSAGVASGQGISMVGLAGSPVNFLNGKYNFGWYPNIDRLNQIFDWWTNFSNYYQHVDTNNVPAPFRIYSKLGFLPNWQAIQDGSPVVNEFYYAGYLMGVLNLGQMISFVPGVRYEKDRSDLTGWWMEQLPSYTELFVPPGYRTDSTHNDAYWLPMIHLRIKPVSWFQAQLSFTQTLNRPSYGEMEPMINLNRTSGAFSYSSGNPGLRPEFWTSYDLGFAAFGNKIGLLSVDAFYKKVKDFIWTPSIFRVPGQPWPYDVGQYFPNTATVLITVPQNHNFPVYLKGLEFEIQTNLWYLPEPFNYITLDANFTLVNSHTNYQYPKTLEEVVGTDSHGRPIFKLVAIDSIYSGPMLNQPKSMVNFSFGYNYRGFNLWLSYQYIGVKVTSFPNLTEFENVVAQTAKWDLQLTQKLPIHGLELVFDVANINNPHDLQNNLGDPRLTYDAAYGWTTDLGIRLSL